jgi:hypothetical protein
MKTSSGYVVQFAPNVPKPQEREWLDCPAAYELIDKSPTA